MSTKRLREIIHTFRSVGWLSLSEKGKPDQEKQGPKRLRQAFEQLGPSFVKIGQILSTRSDILPAVYVEELSKLQDDVLPIDSQVAFNAIEQELGGAISDYFLEISRSPLASGSVAQTHKATLLSGEAVIIKIQRPNLENLVREDLGLLIKLSRHLPKGLVPIVDLPDVLEQLRKSLLYEIDFRHEASAIERFQSLNQGVRCIATPKVYQKFTTARLLVEEFIDGIPINKREELILAGYELEDIGRKLMLSMIKQIFKDGYFHGDPHPGNLMISGGKIYFIDFGIMGHLEKGMRVALNDILYSFTAQDVDGMTRAVLAMTNFDTSLNKVELSRDIERMLAKYGNLDLGALSITDLLEDLVALFVRNRLKASSQMTILEKSSLQVEGIFRDLAPEVDLMSLAKNYFIENMGPDMLKQALNKETLLIELFYLLKNGKNVPRRLNQLLEQVLNGRILINHDIYDYDNKVKTLNRLSNRLVIVLLFLTCMLTGAVLSFNPQFLWLMWLCFSLSVFFLLALLWIMVRGK